MFLQRLVNRPVVTEERENLRRALKESILINRSSEIDIMPLQFEASEKAYDDNEVKTLIQSILSNHQKLH